MRLNEFANVTDNNSSTVDVTDDRLNNRRRSDTRKPRLTLRHLNKLRKMREFKKMDMHEREKYWQVMYGQPPAEDSGEF